MKKPTDKEIRLALQNAATMINTLDGESGLSDRDLDIHKLVGNAILENERFYIDLTQKLLKK